MSSVSSISGPLTITVTESVNVPHNEQNHSFKGFILVGEERPSLCQGFNQFRLKNLLLGNKAQ